MLQEVAKCLKAGQEIHTRFEQSGLDFTNYSMDGFNNEFWIYLHYKTKSVIAIYNAHSEDTFYLYGEHESTKTKYEDFNSLIEVIKNDRQANTKPDGSIDAIDESLLATGA